MVTFVENRIMAATRKDIVFFFAQLAVWAFLIFTPGLISSLASDNPIPTAEILKGNSMIQIPYMIIFFLDIYLLIPRLLFRGRLKSFILLNLLMISIHLFFIFNPIPDHLEGPMRSGVYLGIFSLFIMGVVVATFAVGVRYIMRFSELQMALKEEKQRNAEAELAWLKNQLNPHFLFNTLNNISSLVQIDQDTAQESIGQLSDLLRYTLYESNHEFVPVDGEIEFMRNYIDLMRLRCNELSSVEVEMDEPAKPLKVVPLLFISLIENAFKHGVNSRKRSFVRINFHADGDDLIFTCENSNHPRQEVDRGGSGIGLENLRRRLELAYRGRYDYKQEIRDDIYYVRIKLMECL